MTDGNMFMMPDNNPNELLILAIGILGFYLVVTLISVLFMKKRRRRLKEVQEKLKNCQYMMEHPETRPSAKEPDADGLVFVDEAGGSYGNAI